MVAMGIGRFAYTPILPLMQNDLSFSDALAGYLATSNYGGYLLGALLAGVLPLRKHKTMYLRISLVVSIVTTFSMGLSHSYFLMLVFRFISGIASAFIFVLASSIVLDKLAAVGKTNWSGIFYSGVGLGIFLTGLFVPSLNHLFHWEGAWVGLAIVSGALTVFVWMWLKDSHNIATKKHKQEVFSQAQLPPAKWLPWLVAAYGIEGLGYIVTGTFIVSIAEKTSTVGSVPTFVWMIVGLAAVPSCILWSSLAKKRGFVTSLVLAMTLQSIGIAMPVFLASQTFFIISAILFGATFMGITTLATTLARQMNPANSSKIISYMTAIYAVGQMVGPTIAGVLASITQNFNAALIGAACAVFIGSCLLINGIRFEKLPITKNTIINYNK
ncbi:MAG TPA: YbfB/YjiJ family MFS transporter [Bacillus bacterium]|nr:YbfB/YjiJ family MFS transporter [Bacillus sp. (in: firmicutes)]